MQLNPSEISDIIKSKIDGSQKDSDYRSKGTVVSVTDGIVRIYGLSEVMRGEMILFPGNVYGMA
ncbi:MAG: F0F1 ATP synthase subunit alpha, partial [Neisseriaceae bacterium]